LKQEPAAATIAGLGLGDQASAISLADSTVSRSRIAAEPGLAGERIAGPAAIASANWPLVRRSDVGRRCQWGHGRIS